MRYLVISDVHANLEALDAVLAAAGAWDHVLALGDFVGYGADPNAVIDRLGSLAPATWIRGNHDKVGCGLEAADSFNQLARRAIEWTSRQLTDDHREWLATLPEGPVVVNNLVEICHGAPYDEDAYVFDDLDATRAIQASGRPVCLFGHTHVPAAFALSRAARVLHPLLGTRLDLSTAVDTAFLINCGAVGQPRDGDPRAAFGILDTADSSLTLARVAYDVAMAQSKIVAAGLPEVLAHRLGVGR